MERFKFPQMEGTLSARLRRRITSEERAREETLDLTKGFKIIGLTSEIMKAAFNEDRIEDFEAQYNFTRQRAE